MKLESFLSNYPKLFFLRYLYLLTIFLLTDCAPKAGDYYLISKDTSGAVTGLTQFLGSTSDLSCHGNEPVPDEIKAKFNFESSLCYSNCSYISTQEGAGIVRVVPCSGSEANEISQEPDNLPSPTAQPTLDVQPDTEMVTPTAQSEPQSQAALELGFFYRCDDNWNCEQTAIGIDDNLRVIYDNLLYTNMLDKKLKTPQGEICLKQYSQRASENKYYFATLCDVWPQIKVETPNSIQKAPQILVNRLYQFADGCSPRVDGLNVVFVMKTEDNIIEAARGTEKFYLPDTCPARLINPDLNNINYSQEIEAKAESIVERLQIDNSIDAWTICPENQNCPGSCVDFVMTFAYEWTKDYPDLFKVELIRMSFQHLPYGHGFGLVTDLESNQYYLVDINPGYVTGKNNNHVLGPFTDKTTAQRFAYYNLSNAENDIVVAWLVSSIPNASWFDTWGGDLNAAAAAVRNVTHFEHSEITNNIVDKLR